MTILNENTQTTDLWEDSVVVHHHSWVHVSCDASSLLPHFWFWQLTPLAPGEKPNLSHTACNLPFLLGRKKKNPGIWNRIGLWTARDWKKTQTQSKSLCLQYNHFRGKNKTTEKSGFSQNTPFDSISLPRFKTNKVCVRKQRIHGKSILVSKHKYTMK